MRTSGWPGLPQLRLAKPLGRARKLAVSAFVPVMLGVFPSLAEEGDMWPAGSYMLSDELGDFAITAVG